MLAPLQLRQACIHPQLTRAWREMAAEGQLGMGTTLSMEEIMQRLVDQAQFDLQVRACCESGSRGRAWAGVPGSCREIAPAERLHRQFTCHPVK